MNISRKTERAVALAAGKAAMKALGKPESYADELIEMGDIKYYIEDMFDEKKAISVEKVKRYNELAYKFFPEEQDGSEFEKEKPKEGPKAVGTIQIKTEDLEESDKTPEELLTPKISPSDTHALEIVGDYIEEHLDKSDGPVLFNLFIVWKCKVLQNWKYLISSTLPDGMYYELTYNGDKGEWYLDAYKKFENRVVR